MRIKLTDELRQSGWRSSIMTTYSVDPQFYDRFVASKLRAFGCDNNILVADAEMLAQAIVTDPDGFLGAGRRYAVAPAVARGCFHPKLALRLAPDKARLVVGSANITAAGWGRNQEIACALDFSSRSGAHAPLAPLIRKAFDYLNFWLREPNEAIAYKLDLIDRQTPWLRDLQPNTGPVELEDGSLVDLWLDSASGDTGMLALFVAALDGEPVHRLTLVSPYWDTDLAGFRELRRALGDPPVTIALNPELNTFPIHALDNADGVEFASLRDQMEGRFVHAKLIVAHTAHHDHLLFGSANCSDDALGTLTAGARNAEASVYQRLAAGSAAAQLQIDLTKIVDPSDILLPERQVDAPNREVTAPSGSVALDIDRLIWTPPTGVAPEGASIALLDGEQLPLLRAQGGRWVAAMPSPPKTVLVVRLAYANGRLSGPSIVNDLRSLRRAAPGEHDRRLNDAIDKVLAGDGDIIDLALDAQALFNDGPVSSSMSTRAGHGRERPERVVPTGDFGTATEFREAMSARVASGATGRFLTDDPGLHDVLAIVLRGIATVDSRVGDRIRGDNEANDLSAGEDEDGDDSGVGPLPGADEPVVKPRKLTLAELELRGRKLSKVIALYTERIEALAQSEESPPSSLPIQTVFMLKLMIYACTKSYETSSKAKPTLKGDATSEINATLMRFRPEAGRDNGNTFTVQTAKILRGIWRATPQGSPVFRLLKPGGFEHLPDDLFYLTAMSRWAMIRALLAVVGVVGLETLEKIIAATAAEVFKATLEFGALDLEAEERFVRRLDEVLGFSSRETDDLLRHARALL